MPIGNRPTLYNKTVREVAAELGISVTTVCKDERKALDKIAAVFNPDGIHYVAHDTDEKEIDRIFRTLPWCKVLIFPDKTYLTKLVWKDEYERRNRTYKVT